MKKITFILLLSFSLINCNEINQTENLLTKIDSLKIKNDSLIKISNNEEPNLNYWFDEEYEGIKFIENGIYKPAEFIESALREKTELIPLKAILGGTMTFGKIQLLSAEWIIADYSDGHIAGRGIYTYELNDKRKLQFRLLKSIGPE